MSAKKSKGRSTQSQGGKIARNPQVKVSSDSDFSEITSNSMVPRRGSSFCQGGRSRKIQRPRSHAEFGS